MKKTINNVRIFDGQKLTAPTNVVIENGYISYIGGLLNVEILRGATTDAAQFFGLSDRGSIVPGKRADLVLVDGDPTKDISVCRNIQRVWVKGIEVDLTK